MSNDVYNTAYWSEGYFQISETGELLVCDLDTSGEVSASIPFSKILTRLKDRGIRWPVLVRFKHILRDRVLRLHDAFHQAMYREDYDAKYVAVYPIKVNQQRNVVAEIAHCHQPDKRQSVGLEAGSKPELLAVYALLQSKENQSEQRLVICNGYKDRAYIRLALLGIKLGWQVMIVIEKLSELNLVFEEAAALNITPMLGVRVRLAMQGKGNWQNSGGEGSKFGLAAKAVLDLVEFLIEKNALDSLKLLHFHMGSQISNIQDIRKCMQEATRFYLELKALGAPVTWMDVGGGLGIDYEGTRSRNYCSMNYDFKEYANVIVHELKSRCLMADVAVPNIITESGRALTAHHAVLLAQVMDVEQPAPSLNHELKPPKSDSSNTLKDLWQVYQSTLSRLDDRSLLEVEHQLKYQFLNIQEAFMHGSVNLLERAEAENYYYAGCEHIRAQLKNNVQSHQHLLNELNEKLAENLFVNFSLFQSMPDVWGINQIFPIMPLNGLNEEVQHRARVQDITCDSDGRIDQYVDGMGIETTLPLPSKGFGKNQVLGMFLVGAYQEILGDMHNLFGDTDAVDIEFVQKSDGTFDIELVDLTRGDTVEKVLRYVHFDGHFILDRLEAQIADADVDLDEKSRLLTEFRASLYAYTYLESDD